MLTFTFAEICRFAESSRYDLSSVQTIVYAGSNVSPRHEREIFDRFPSLVNVLSVSKTTLQEEHSK